jgi:hypothetical protein
MNLGNSRIDCLRFISFALTVGVSHSMETLYDTPEQNIARIEKKQTYVNSLNLVVSPLLTKNTLDSPIESNNCNHRSGAYCSFVTNAQLYDREGGNRLTTDPNSDLGTNYIVDSKGKLHFQERCEEKDFVHSYFCFSIYPSDSDQFKRITIGKSVAGAGTMNGVDGIITEITNFSGHYRINPQQFAIVIHYLGKKLGILSKPCKIQVCDPLKGGTIEYDSVEDFLAKQSPISQILETYPNQKTEKARRQTIPVFQQKKPKPPFENK